MGYQGGGRHRTRALSPEVITTHLASDYIHPTPRGGQCCVGIFLAEEEQDVPVVNCSELPTPLGWIEHWPEESTDGGEF